MVVCVMWPSVGQRLWEICTQQKPGNNLWGLTYLFVSGSSNQGSSYIENQKYQKCPIMSHLNLVTEFKYLLY